ncbi:MAG: hypothetical protein QM703_22670 [Gemmatales bacterium]
MSNMLAEATVVTGMEKWGSNSIVEAFESAWHELGDAANIEAFLPSRDSPLYSRVLVELIRVDLDHCNKQKKARTLEWYRARFPELFLDHAAVSILAFEEYRLRRLAGEQVTPQEYQKRFSISVDGWEVDLAPDHSELASTSPGSSDSLPREAVDAQSSTSCDSRDAFQGIATHLERWRYDSWLQGS